MNFLGFHALSWFSGKRCLQISFLECGSGLSPHRTQWGTPRAGGNSSSQDWATALNSTKLFSSFTSVMTHWSHWCFLKACWLRVDIYETESSGRRPASKAMWAMPKSPELWRVPTQDIRTAATFCLSLCCSSPEHTACSTLLCEDWPLGCPCLPSGRFYPPGLSYHFRRWHIIQYRTEKKEKRWVYESLIKKKVLQSWCWEINLSVIFSLAFTVQSWRK